ncbi:MAG: hypothetical protein M3116_02785 [Actinomycetota bacterium]|nr:hypothetical protein [Actinomycetota bacterium]
MTLELERNTLASNPHEPLVLVGTRDLADYLVVVEGSPAALAVAVIRSEQTGTYCYPHSPVHPRLGPFGSIEEALEACREVQRTERCYDSCCQGLP